MVYLYAVAIILLLIGVADMPIGFYTFLRFVACFTCGLSSYISFKQDDKAGAATVVFALLALLFNPVFPVYLRDKFVWSIIDIMTAFLLVIRCYMSCFKKDK